jgi:hypothetical protein
MIFAEMSFAFTPQKNLTPYSGEKRNSISLK